MSTVTTTPANTNTVNGIVIETDKHDNDAAVNNYDNDNDNDNTSINAYNITNAIAYAVNTFVTFAIGTFGLFGRPDNGEISDKYQTVVTPFGTSFSIWGLIFAWQAFWVCWQLFVPSQRNSEGVIRAWYYYSIMTIFQAGWTIAFSYELMWVALVCMYIILGTLIMASMSIQKYTDKTWKGYLLWQAPFSVQTGWIMAASGLMTNVMTVFYDSSSTVRIIVASLTLAVLTITALSWLSSYPVDFAIPLVIIWALGGIYAELNAPKQSIVDTFTTKQINGIQNGVLAGLCLIGACVILKVLYVFIKQRPAAATASKQQQEQQAKEDGKQLDNENV